MKKGILLVNLGTPDSLDRKDIARYLKEFLGDPYVIDLPFPLRQILVHGIIVPFRTPKSQRMYRKVWTDKGSPLAINHQLLLEKVRKLVAEQFASNGVEVEAVMRYRKPSIVEGLTNLKRKGVESLVVLPLFPQYASSTHDTIFEQVRQFEHDNSTISNAVGAVFEKVEYIRSFYKYPLFIQAFAEKIATYSPAAYDHVIFSYHSLPESHLEKEHPGLKVSNCSCAYRQVSEEPNCYKAQAYQTTRLLVEALGLSIDQCTTSFQSRFARQWVGPFTDETILHLAQRGAKRVLIVAPSFVADCLETIYELGQEYKEQFMKAGGKELVLVESLNDSTLFAQMILAL